MAKVVYVGVSNKAKKVKKLYVGVAGKARKVKKAYIGVGGKARLCYSAGYGNGTSGLYACDLYDHKIIYALNPTTFTQIRAMPFLNGVSDWVRNDGGGASRVTGYRMFGTSGMLVAWYYTTTDSDDNNHNPKLVEINTETGGVSRVLLYPASIKGDSYYDGRFPVYQGATSEYILRYYYDYSVNKRVIEKVNPENMASIGTIVTDITSVAGAITGGNSYGWIPTVGAKTSGKYPFIFKKMDLSNGVIVQEFNTNYGHASLSPHGNIDDLGDCWSALYRVSTTTTWSADYFKKLNKSTMAEILSCGFGVNGDTGADMTWTYTLVTVK